MMYTSIDHFFPNSARLFSVGDLSMRVRRVVHVSAGVIESAVITSSTTRSRRVCRQTSLGNA
jgi:hypothetical protein